MTESAVVRFGLESWATYFRDAQLLWDAHYEELCVDKERMPMMPDAKMYRGLEDAGQLQIMCARRAGLMVGYQLSILRPHPHYATVLCGFEDSFWLAPSMRHGWLGIKLIQESIKAMQTRGVKKVFFQSNQQVPGVERIFDYLGFKRTHIVHAKWIGD